MKHISTKFIKVGAITAAAILTVLCAAACQNGSDKKDDASSAGQSSAAESSAAESSAAESSAAESSAAEASADEKSEASQGGNTAGGETWGNITVAVPDGMTLTGGNVLDANNPDVLTIKKDDNELNYFLVTAGDYESSAKAGIESTREFNEGAKDVSVDAGTTWTGVTYDYFDTPAFHIYGKVDGRVAVIQSFGFDVESDVAKSLLSSIKLTAAE